MPQYRKGTVDLVNGSVTVTGDIQFFTEEVQLGDLFIAVDDNTSYEIASVVNNTALTLTAPYGGVTRTGAAYVISRDFTPLYGIPYPSRGDIETTTVFKDAMMKLDSFVGDGIDAAEEAQASAVAAAGSASASAASALAAAGSESDASTSAANASTSASTATTQAGNASASASDADTSATEAATSASNASTSATDAANEADDSADSALESEHWAHYPEDSLVPEGNLANEYSSYHYMKKAQVAASGVLRYAGSWDASSGSYPTTPVLGDFWKVSGAGTVSGDAYSVGDQIIYNGSAWDKIDNTEAVTSVAGKVGAVTLAIADVASLQSSLDGKALSSHTHTYLPLAGGVLAGDISSKGYARFTGAPGVASADELGPGVELAMGGGIASSGAYDRRLGQYKPMQVFGSTVALWAGGTDAISLSSSFATISRPTNISSGTSMPLTLTTSSNGPWALSLARSDLGTDVKVYNSGGYWAFGNPMTVAGRIVNSGDTLQSDGKIQSNGWAGSYAAGLGIAIGVSAGLAYLHTYNGTTGVYGPLRIVGSTVDILIGGTSYLRVLSSGNTQTTGSIHNEGGYYYGVSTRNAMQDASDGYLRLNNSLHYSSGVYTSGAFRASGAITCDVGISGASVSASAVMYATGYYQNDTAFYLYNTSGYSYGSWRIGGTRGGYMGLVLDTPARPTWMTSGGNTHGVYMQSSGYWSYYDNGSTFSINNAVSAPSFQTTSSRELKKESGEITAATAILKQLRPIKYRLNAFPDDEQLGLIAEEVHEICPELSPDGKSVRYDRIAMLLLAEWQERNGVQH